MCNRTYCIYWHSALQWRYNERNGVSNYRRIDCLLNFLFRRRSKKTSKLRVTGLCEGNSPHKGPIRRKLFSFDDAIMVYIYFASRDNMLFDILYICFVIRTNVYFQTDVFLTQCIAYSLNQPNVRFKNDVLRKPMWNEFDNILPYLVFSTLPYLDLPYLHVSYFYRKLYWTDSSKKALLVSELNGTFVRTLLDHSTERPRAITVHPRLGYVARARFEIIVIPSQYARYLPHHIRNFTTSYSHDDVIKWKHFPRNWPFVQGIHRSPVNSPHKGQWRGALMFSLICVWINGWVNNREAGNWDAIVPIMTSPLW